MADNAQNKAETGVKKIARFPEFKNHYAPVQFTEERFDDDDATETEPINRDLNIMFGKHFTRILTKKQPE